MPLRPVENGRQASGDSTLRYSQARIVAGVRQASVPPVTTRSTMPDRTRLAATPIAWVAEAQALVTVKVGPVMPWAMPMCEAPELGMIRGTAWVSNRSPW